MRDKFEDKISDLSSILNVYSNTNDALCGNLNYIVFKIVKKLTDHNNGGERSYARFNAILGSLECCKQEIYRRMIVPYEDEKIKENGDVI